MIKQQSETCICKKNKAETANKTNLSKLPKLDARLAAAYAEVIKFAEPGDIVADIGTDHGFLAVHLAASGKFSKVLATDVSKPSLAKAANLSNTLRLQVDCRAGNGLLAAPDCTIAAICGMGGWEIIKILGQPTEADRFVLVAMQNPVQLRQFLLNNNYIIATDYLVSEHKKYYFVMSAIKRTDKKCNLNNQIDMPIYGTQELYFGQNFDATSRLAKLYLQNQINNLNFLDNFDKLTTLQKQDSMVVEKYNYYKLCKKLLQEGQDDPRHN